jgi:uncharacterized protein YwgA
VANINKLMPIIKKIAGYQQPGKKALQKLIYLVEKKGVDLGFNFSIHYYGPYSSTLDDAVHSLQMQGVIDIVPDGMSHRIHVTELSDMMESTTLSQTEEQEIEDVLRTFGRMTAFDLELITTTDFVARALRQSGKTCMDDDIIEGVRRIKGDKFSQDKMTQAIIQLRNNGYQWN